MIAKYFITALLCILMLTACSEDAPNKEAGAEAFQSYENIDYTVLYPGSFKNEVLDDRVIFASEAPSGGIGETFSIVVKKYETEAPSVTQMANTYSAQQLDDLRNLSIENERNAYIFPTGTSSGVRALESYQEYDDKETGESVVAYNLLVPLDAKLYILSYTCSKETYESIKNNVVAKVTKSIRIKHTPVSNWNTTDLDIDTNGNEALAIQELTTFRVLNNGEKVSPAKLFEAPQNYYGKAVTVTGKVEYVDSFSPIGGIQSEIIIKTSDGTLVDVLGINRAKEDLKIGYPRTLTGLPIGKGDVADSEGVMHTYIFLVSNERFLK
ncbi:hypothetical protein [Cohnella mopanensis]|uniref:hypothetical protein n=1 Tax=Cohnella mopanensis TaxID=2911966 RepID=UPI001EF926AA|nr:hypothetical protein [Cohnella mopanensis]